MQSFLPYLKTLNRISPQVRIRKTVLPLLLSSSMWGGTILLGNEAAQAAPTRRDWCGTIWSVENQNTLAWINPSTGVTTTGSGPTSQITMPGGSMGTATAAIGIHKQSGTMYAFDRSGTTGTLYKYQFGVNTTWQAVAISGLVGLSGTQSIAGASNNLNKMSVDGNTLFIAESNGVAVYAIPLNSSGSVVGSATIQTYSFVGDPPGTPPHRSSTSTDPAGTEVINGGDIVTDEYGDVYNITYNNIISYSGGSQILTTTKAYFYKQDPIAKTWIYEGQTTGNASFAGAAFYRGDLYVKAGTQLKKVDLTHSGTDYTGWNNPLVNVGSPSSTSSADLAACGTPVISLTKTRQIYSDALLTTLVTDQTKVRTGQYIKYTVTAQNVGDAWARSTQIIDNLPAGTVYQPNSATLNGTNLGLVSYPSSFTVNSPSISAGIVRYPTDPDTATLSFAVQVTATSGNITNQATTSYVDNDGLPSDPSVCTTTPKTNCGNDGPGVTVVSSFSVNGTVWNDVDGSITINGSEIGTNAGSSNLTIYTVDSTGVVVGKATVSSTDGTYSIPGLLAGNYTLRLSNDASAAVGSPGPAASLPTNWVNTGENKNGVTETTTPGEIAVTVASANIINQNFGIEQLPNTTDVTLSGTVFSDADADVTINGSDAGTNARSANLTIYAVDAAGKVVDKATVAANGTYSLTNVPANSSVKLRLSNDSSVAIGATAPTSPSLPTGWFHTGKNLNGTIDGAIATLGDIALTTTATNVTNQNFGIRQSYVITPDPAPSICNPDYTGALTTGISASGGQLPVGSNDLNWTVEWIQGPSTSGVDTPYALPRPVGVMPAVVVGNLAVGAWLNEPANARWISYPFRLSTNGNGYHSDANLNGISSELSSATPGGTTDAVRLKFTSTVTLPSNANTLAISLPIGVAVDNQFVSIKINGVENLVPAPTPDAQAPGFFSTSSVNVKYGWQPGVNTIEIVIDSGPDYVGFFLKVEATTTQVCSPANVLLVKRITAINGTPINKYVDDTTSAKKDDDSHPNWPAPLNSDSNLGDITTSSFLRGLIDGGTVKPSDEVEYTIYFLATGNSPATNVNFCDLVPANVTFIPTAFTKQTPGDAGIVGADAGIQLTIGNTTTYLTNIADGDRGEYFAPGTTPSVKCPSGNSNGAVVVKVVNSQSPAPNDELPNAIAPGTPTGSYGFIRFRGRVK
jgi:uncharacterized repeat protein (TIGR01451 family)